jgi:hypothetical protein
MRTKVEFRNTRRAISLKHEDGTKSVWKYEIEFDPEYFRPYRARILNGDNQVIRTSFRASLANTVRQWALEFIANIEEIFHNNFPGSHSWLDDDEIEQANTERAA